MTIFRSSLAMLSALGLVAGGHSLWDKHQRDAVAVERQKLIDQARLTVRMINQQCDIPRSELVIWNEVDGRTLGIGYEPEPITLLPSYGWCPPPENDENIACATKVAASQGLTLGRPAVIGECPRFGLVE